MIPINVNLPLKTVTERIQSCRAVLWALDTFGDRLVGVLAESFVPLLVDAEVMPFETQLALFKRKLILGRDQMVATDRAYRDQRARESIFRARRDAEAGEVNADVVGLRRAFLGIYAEDKLAEFGFARRTPQKHEDLLEQASHLAARLSDPKIDLSGARFDEFQFEASNLGEKLLGSVEKLKGSVEELTREERKTEALKLAKDEALAEYNRWFLWIARTVESLCRVAGLDEVAQRIRPSSRRAGVTARKFEQPEDDKTEGETSSEASPPEVPSFEASSSETASSAGP